MEQLWLLGSVARLDGADDRHLVHLLQVLLHRAGLRLEHVLVRRPQLQRLQLLREPAHASGDVILVPRMGSAHYWSASYWGSTVLTLRYR